MKQKFVIFVLIFTLISSICITTGSAKEIESLAEIAATSKLEPLGADTELNAFVELGAKKASALPSSYSSKDLGFTTAVRQQDANICWAFSSLATLETHLMKSGRNISHFSPEHMNYWGSKDSDGYGWQRSNLVNDGGYSYIAMGYFTSWSGPLLDSHFPVGSTASDYAAVNQKYSSDYGVTGIKYIDQNTPIDTIKSYIMQYGAVIANFSADTTRYMNSDTDSFYCSNSSIPTNQLYGHSVSIVGWDDNYSKTNFSSSYSGDTPSNNGAWLIKNSWGSHVNDIGGYFWISYEDAWIFNSIFGPSFAISGYETIDSSKKLYQNEKYGATTQFSYLTNKSSNPANEVTYVNVFDFSSDYAELDKILFETTSLDADYTLYYIPVTNGTPSSNTSEWTTLGSGVVDYTGYICVDIANRILPEGEGAIGVSLDNTRTYNANKNTSGYTYIPNSLGVSEWLGYGGNYYFKYQADYGDSFLMWNNGGTYNCSDIMDFYNTYLNDDMGATLVIKAITAKTGSAPEITEPAPTVPETTTESTTSAQQEPLILSVNMQETSGNNFIITANATGGSGEYQYRMDVNNIGYQEYSDNNVISLHITEDGIYTIKVTARDSENHFATASFSFEVVDGNATLTTTPETSDPAETTPTNTGKTHLMGDVDFSGHISIKDTTVIRKALAKFYELTSIQATLSDVNGDGKLSITDATLIQKHIALYKTNSTVGQPVTVDA